MAIKLSDSRSFKLEPVRKNRFIFQFSSIPGEDSNQPEALAFVAHSCNAPQISFNKESIKRMNENFNYAGSVSWNDISCSFYDFIRNTSANKEHSAGEILYNWASIIYNPLTGQMGYKTQYATAASLVMLDPAGNVIRCWNLYGIFPISVDWGAYSYDDGGVSEVNAQFAYDIAVKVMDATSATESA